MTSKYGRKKATRAGAYVSMWVSPIDYSSRETIRGICHWKGDDFSVIVRPFS